MAILFYPSLATPYLRGPTEVVQPARMLSCAPFGMDSAHERTYLEGHVVYPIVCWALSVPLVRTEADIRLRVF